MSDENQENIIATIINLLQAYVRQLTGIFHLAKLETKLAVESVILIAILFFVGLFLMAATWFCLLALLFVFLQSLNLTAMVSISIVTALNILLMLVAALCVSKIKQNLYFRATRQQISNLASGNQELGNELIEKTN